MKTLFTLAFLSFLMTFASAQSFPGEPVLDPLISSLLNKGIDTILVYEQGVLGNNVTLVEADDTCVYTFKDKTYTVLWRANGQDFVSVSSSTKCYDYNIIKYDLSEVWAFCDSAKKKIKKEHLLEPSYREKGHTYSLIRDHYAYSGIMLTMNKYSVQYEVIDYYFSEMIDNNKPNANYAHNIKSLRRKLQIMVNETVKKIENAALIKKVFKQ